MPAAGVPHRTLGCEHGVFMPAPPPSTRMAASPPDGRPSPVLSAALAQHTGVHHGFFTRCGGTSLGLYESLNAGEGSHDHAANVRVNRTRIAATMGLKPTHLLTNAQIHGNRVVIADRPYDGKARPRADAMVTRHPGLGLGILTADCAPVLFADRRAAVVGAAHAGWKGALNGVLEATVDGMIALGAGVDTLVAAVGPTIQQPCYQVDEGFRLSFLHTNPSYARFFLADDKPGKYRFDLPGFVVFRLRRLGLKTVEALACDTYGASDLFFSYRRACHSNEPDYGRQLSVIALT